MAYLASGGDGCISIVVNLFPDLCHEIQVKGCGSGNVQVARSLASRLMALATILSGELPVAALKYGMSLLGFMKPAVRLPLVELGEEARQAVTQAMTAVNDNIRPANSNPADGRKYSGGLSPYPENDFATGYPRDHIAGMAPRLAAVCRDTGGFRHASSLGDRGRA